MKLQPGDSCTVSVSSGKVIKKKIRGTVESLMDNGKVCVRFGGDSETPEAWRNKVFSVDKENVR